jgi:hypothetical protein
MKTPAAPKTVLEAILDWSQDGPAWLRDALRRIVSEAGLDAADVNELAELCKAGKSKNANGSNADPLVKKHLPANPGQGKAVSLVSIEDVVGVNNLVAHPFDAL